LYVEAGTALLAKIAASIERALAHRRAHGGPGRTEARLLAKGDGWTVEDVVCSCGPYDRPFEEQHDHVAVAIVMAGSFQYRSSGVAAGREMMTPGSLLLGNPGQYFECGHEHAAGDRCLSFRFTPEYFESTTAGAHARGARRTFGLLRLPPVRDLSPLVAHACAAIEGSADVPWEELGVRLAVQAVQLDGGRAPSPAPVSAAALARVTRTVRAIDQRPGEGLTLAGLARLAGLSPFHFLRTFESLIGVTPHQYLMRARLRLAAERLALEPARILDIALESGFGDVSNFNRAFRAEFGISPRAYRRADALRHLQGA
jgi:AraC family transcriptional regulator